MKASKFVERRVGKVGSGRRGSAKEYSLLTDLAQHLFFTLRRKGADSGAVYVMLWFLFRHINVRPVSVFSEYVEADQTFVCDLVSRDVLACVRKWVCSKHDCVQSVVSDGDERLAKIRFGGKWATALSFYIDHIPSGPAKLVSDVLKILGDPDRCEVETIDFLSFVSDVVKAEFPRGLGGPLRYLVDMKVMGGYNTYLNNVDPVKPWFEKMLGKRDSLPGDQVSKLKKHLDNSLDSIRWKKDCKLSVGEFVTNRGYWEGSGSALRTKFVVTVDGRRVKLRSKAGAMLQYSDEEILEQMRSMDIISDTFQKSDEPVKARVIQNVSMNSYLRCSYLNEFIDALPDWTPLEKKGKEVRDIWDRLANCSEWGYSLDFSGFDSNVRPDLFQYVLDGLGVRAAKNGAEGWVAECESGSSIKSFGFGSGYKLECDGWLGLPSGHRWTALIGTLINRAVSEWLRETLGTIWDSYHQGDDIAIFSRGELSMERVSALIGTLGMEINPHKTVVCRGGIEFLRNWCSGGKVIPYPARLVRNLLWYKPGSGLLLQTWIDRLRDSGSSIRRARSWGLRGLGTYGKGVLRRETPSFLSGIERGKLTNWFFGSGWLGGAGAGENEVCWFPRLSAPPKKKLEIDVVLPGVRGLRLMVLLKDEVPLKGFRRELTFEGVKTGGSEWVEEKCSSSPVALLPPRKDPEWWAKSVVATVLGYSKDVVSAAVKLMGWEGGNVPEEFVMAYTSTVLPDLSYLADRLSILKLFEWQYHFERVRKNLLYWNNLSSYNKVIKNIKYEKTERLLQSYRIQCLCVL